MKTLLPLILALLLLGWQPKAHALACGDTVATDTVLSADLHCDSGWTALYVPVAGVTIDLNGYTLSGDRTLHGIVVFGASDVRIVGPGRISGFRSGVNATRGDRLNVLGVDFYDMGTGIAANDTLAADLRANTLGYMDGFGISLTALAGSRATLGAHAIEANWIHSSQGGIGICGHANSDSLIKDNDLEYLSDFGIDLYDGTAQNQVQDNLLREVDLAGIALRSSSGNLLSGNYLFRTINGVAMIPEFTGTCATGPVLAPWVRDNRVFGNTFTLQSVAVKLGNDRPKGRWVLDNLITENPINQSGIGLRFHRDSYRNDGRGNTYANVDTPVLDTGLANTHIAAVLASPAPVFRSEVASHATGGNARAALHRQ